MHRILCLLQGYKVAAGVSAVGRSNLQIVIIVDVARGAGNVGVPVREWKSRRRVVEIR